MDKKIASDDVKIITETRTLYRAEDNHRYFLTESSARAAASNASKCEDCGAYVSQYRTVCDSCQDKRNREHHLKILAVAPEWSGTYPVCIGERFFMTEDDLLDFIWDNKITMAEVDNFYACTEIHATDAIQRDKLIEMVEESMGFDDAECPDCVTDIIDEFMAKLETIKEPIAWEGNKLVRLTEAQINDFQKQMSECEREEEDHDR